MNGRTSFIPWALMILLGASGALPTTAAVQIAQVHYQGWAGSYYLTNGTVEAVVVPAIGRIMRYAFVGGESPLWENPAWLGKTREQAEPGEWANFGGDKNWPAPQSEWAQHVGRAWPPDFAFDGLPYRAEVLPEKNALRLTSQVSEAYGLRVIRTIHLADQGTTLTIEQQFEKLQGPPCTVSIWSITQVRDGDELLMPLNASGTLTPLSQSLDPNDWQPEGRWLRVRRNPNRAAKAGVPGEASWLAWVQGDLWFRIRGDFDPEAVYPDGGSHLEIYTSRDPLAYSELEVLGPLHTYTIGDRSTYTLTWELGRFPKTLNEVQRRAFLAGDHEGPGTEGD